MPSGKAHPPACSSLPIQEQLGEAGKFVRLENGHQQVPGKYDRTGVRIREHLLASPDGEHRNSVFLPDLELANGFLAMGEPSTTQKVVLSTLGA